MIFSSSNKDFLSLNPYQSIVLIKRDPLKKYVLLCVATWCGYCTKLIPEIVKVDKYFNNQVDFLIVDETKENGLHAALNVKSYPSVFPISQDGKVITSNKIDERTYETLCSRLKLEYNLI